MRHIMKGNPLILLANFDQEFLQIQGIDLELLHKLKKLEHAIPTAQQSAPIILQIRHVDVKHVDEGLRLPLQPVALYLLGHWLLQLLF